MAGALDEFGYGLDELASDGITVETNSAGVYLGDDRYHPLHRELNRRRAVVFVHPTSPPCAEMTALGRPRPMLEFLFDTTRSVSHLIFTGTLLRYPDIQWVFTHGGGALPLLADRMELFRTVIVDDDDPRSRVPRQLRRLWFDIAGTPFPLQVPAVVAAFGTERVALRQRLLLDASRVERAACVD